MSRPIKWQASPSGLKEMSDTDMDYVAYRVASTFAGSQSGGGTLNTSSGTSIGSFSDNIRNDAIGTHPTLGAQTTTTTTIYQDLVAITPTPQARPLYWSASKPGLQEMSDSVMNTDLCRYVMTYMIADGLGTYALQPSAPAGGTWSSIAILTDTTQSGDTSETIWRKTASTAPATTVRPMKFSTGVREMTDADLNDLVDNLREYIRTTGRGQYKLQTDTPTTGTWVAKGSMTDTRQVVSDTNYRKTIGYTGTYYQYAVYNQFAAYYQYADYRRTINYQTTIAYRKTIGYVITYGTYFQFANYYQYAAYYQFADYRRTINYQATLPYQSTVGYDGTYYQYADYAGLTVQSNTQNVSTVTLWMRTA